MSSVNDIPSGWVETKLADVVSKLGDGLHGTPKYSEEGEYFFINGNNLNDGKIEIKKETKKCTKEEYEKYKKNLNSRTILVSINGSLGYFAYYNNEKCFLGKSACYFNVKKSISKKFIGYQIRRNYFQKYIRRLAGGTTIKNVSLKTMREYPFVIPKNIEEQKAIANILTAYDDKIENLQAQNKTLEQTAQTIFKEWFEKYQMADVLPDGWSTVKIKDFDAIVTDYVANGSFASLAENVNYKNVPDFAKLIRLTDYNRDFNGDFVYVDEKAYNFLSKSELNSGDVIISNVGAYAGTVFKCPDLNYPMTLGPNSIVIKSNFNNYFYLLFTSRIGKHMLDSIITGSAQPKFNKTSFRNLKLRVNQEYLEKFELTVRGLMEKIDVNDKQIETLRKTRDTLLPKLMSGQIRVNEFIN